MKVDINQPSTDPDKLQDGNTKDKPRSQIPLYEIICMLSLFLFSVLSQFSCCANPDGKLCRRPESCCAILHTQNRRWQSKE
jgi:hypothetical protein